MAIHEILMEAPNNEYRFIEDVAGQSVYMQHYHLPGVPSKDLFVDLTFYGEDGEVLSSLH